MKWYKPTKIEWRLYIVLMPILGTLCNYLLFDEQVFSCRIFTSSSLVMFATGLVAWYAYLSFANYINTRFGHYSQVDRRTGWIFVLRVAVISCTLSAIFVGYDVFGYLGYQLNMERYVIALVFFFYMSAMATVISGFRHTAQQLQSALAERDELEQENLAAEFEGLKNYVPPHFLYSSLNSLSVLIEESPRNAEVFVDEMSKVCRYLLPHTGDGITELGHELEFIISYFYLLKTRYGSAISFEIEVNEESKAYLVPTQTLQLLVENAVRHNRLDKKAPLKIEIKTSRADRLTIANTLQRKVIKLDSAGAGLDNIKNKLRVLERDEIVVREEEDKFIVDIPLVAKATRPHISILQNAGWH